MKVLFVCAFLLATLAVPFMAEVISERERYIVLLKEGATDEQIEEVIQMVEGHEASPREELFIQSDNTLLPIFYGEISEETANKIFMSNIVDQVEKDLIVSIEKNMGDFNVTPADDLENTEATTIYNLDLIDDVFCTDGTYNPFNYGNQADIYILDTGINYNHDDFGWLNGFPGTRAYYGGYDAVDAATGTNIGGSDCNGHGSHVAGIAGGKYTGIAPDANLYSIRVLSCGGSGQISWIIQGITAVSNQHEAQKSRSGFVGSIINLSLRSGKASTLDAAVNAAVSKGIIVVTASGNDALDACLVNPGSAGLNINVGNHGYDSSACAKPMSCDSNYGPCVDIMAPGTNIISARHDAFQGLTRKSGTSMAAPHVAGIAALMKRANNKLTPAEIKNRIIANGLNDIDRSTKSPQVRAVSHAKRAYITANLVA